MTWRDKLEIGLKDGASFRKDNLPASQVRGRQIPTGPGRSPEIPMARDDRNEVLASEALRGASLSPSEATESDAEAVGSNEGMPPREADQGGVGGTNPID